MTLKAGDSLADGEIILGKPLAPKNQIQLWSAQYFRKDKPPAEVLLRLIQKKHLQDAKLEQVLEKELNRLKALDHTTLFLPIQHGHWKEYFYLITPFFSGHTLRQLMFSHLAQYDIPIPWYHAARVILGLCDALEYAYNKNEKRSAYADPSEQYLHGNLTPEHIGIDTNGTINLLDFGVAKIFRPRYETENGLLEGHPTYLSPEQVTSHYRDPSSELFALGTILYEMCVGQPPYPRVSLVETLRAIQVEPPPPMISKKQDIPVLLQEVALCLLEKHPDDRFSNPNALKRALQRVLDEELPNETLSPDENKEALSLWVQRIKIKEDPFHKDNELDLDEASQFFDDEVPSSHGVLKIKIEGLADDQTRPFNPALDAFASSGLLSPVQLPNAFEGEDATIAGGVPKDDDPTSMTDYPDLPVAFDDDAKMNVLFLDEATSRFSPLTFTPEPGTLPEAVSATSTPAPPSEVLSPISPTAEAASAEMDAFISQTPPPSIPHHTKSSPFHTTPSHAPQTPTPEPFEDPDSQTQPGAPAPLPPETQASTDAEINTVGPIPSIDINDDTLSTPPPDNKMVLYISVVVGLLASAAVLAWMFGLIKF
ncbi:MAG: protein kinase [Myxococcales bacterium]|nr:protein kinase [Myxococcales bacterium]